MSKNLPLESHLSQSPVISTSCGVCVGRFAAVQCYAHVLKGAADFSIKMHRTPLLSTAIILLPSPPPVSQWTLSPIASSLIAMSHLPLTDRPTDLPLARYGSPTHSPHSNTIPTCEASLLRYQLHTVARRSENHNVRQPAGSF